MSPFKASGGRAKWRDAYDLFVAAAVGDVVTYRELGDVLGMDPDKERHRIQVTVRRAALEHEREDKRALDAVTNLGYRIVEASEHIRLARSQQKRSSRALQRGHSKAVNVDLSQVDATTRHALDMVAQAFALQMDFNRRFDVRQRRLEDVVSMVSKRAERSEAEIAELRERLARLESEP